MSAYESIMQGLTEAVDYQQGKINVRKTKLTIKPMKMTFGMHGRLSKGKCIIFSLGR